MSTYVWDKSIEKEMSFVGKAEKSFNTVGLLGIKLDKNLTLKIMLKIFAARQKTK